MAANVFRSEGMGKEKWKEESLNRRPESGRGALYSHLIAGRDFRGYLHVDRG